MMNINFHSADQNWNDGVTIYWFDVSGHAYLADGRYGVAEGGDGDVTALDSESCPADQRDARFILRDCVVTEVLRSEAAL